MTNDMRFTNLLIDEGVTRARLDALLEKLDGEDGGDFLHSYPGRYVKRLVNDIGRMFDRNIDTAQPYYTLEDGQRLLGAISLLYDDDATGSRISDDTMDEVEEIAQAIDKAYCTYTGRAFM